MLRRHTGLESRTVRVTQYIYEIRHSLISAGSITEVLKATSRPVHWMGDRLGLLVLYTLEHVACSDVVGLREPRKSKSDWTRAGRKSTSMVNGRRRSFHPARPQKIQNVELLVFQTRKLCSVYTKQIPDSLCEWHKQWLCHSESVTCEWQWHSLSLHDEWVWLRNQRKAGQASTVEWARYKYNAKL